MFLHEFLTGKIMLNKRAQLPNNFAKSNQTLIFSTHSIIHLYIYLYVNLPLILMAQLTVFCSSLSLSNVVNFTPLCFFHELPASPLYPDAYKIIVLIIKISLQTVYLLYLNLNGLHCFMT